MSRFPILVEKFPPKGSLLIACEACNAEREITPDEIRNECNYMCAQCGGLATYKYEEADRCKGCGKLGFFSLTLNNCCSRKCVLQAEYAESLKGSAA